MSVRKNKIKKLILFNFCSFIFLLLKVLLPFVISINLRIINHKMSKKSIYLPFIYKNKLFACKNSPFTRLNMFLLYLKRQYYLF